MATDLEPDLILLDINLPEMNGIQAAERIRQLVPKCKLVFLTALSDTRKTVQAAFRAGGDGYILKWDASEDLIISIEEFSGGKQYTSHSIAKTWDRWRLSKGRPAWMFA